MKNSWDVMNQIIVNPEHITPDTTVILGFTGYGSIGTLVLNHIIETFNVSSIGYWGSLSWFHKNNLETPITVYKLNSFSDKKIVLVSSRIPVPVVGEAALPDAFWRFLSHEILSWGAKRYIVLGGLREDVRSPSDDSWVALIPTPKYTEVYGVRRTFRDDLSMKGPVSYLLTEGTAFDYPVLAILSYCNTFDADFDAAAMAIKELGNHLQIDLRPDKIAEFDASFLTDFMYPLEEEDMYEDFDEDVDEEMYDDFSDAIDDDDDTNYKGYFGKDNYTRRHSNNSFKSYRYRNDDLDKYK